MIQKEKLLLVPPSYAYADQIASYRKEFLERGDSMDGTSSLREYENPAAWLAWVAQNAKKETCAKGWVPDSQFLCIRAADDRLVGMVDIRHELNEYLAQFGGHIGYSVRASERRKGYAKEQLRLALMECRKLGFEKVLITCLEHNEASMRTILSAGGVYESTVYDGGSHTWLRRYQVQVV